MTDNLKRAVGALRDALNKKGADGSAEQRCNSSELMRRLHGVIGTLSRDFNSQIEEHDLQFTLSDVSEVRERKLPGHPSITSRFIVYNSFWALSFREHPHNIEAFILTTLDARDLPDGELPTSLKLRLKEQKRNSGLWQLNEVPVEMEEINTVVRSLFKDVIVRSRRDFDQVPELLKLKLAPDGRSLSGSVQDLLAEKYALIQKIVSQQEWTQGRIARDIHDAVIGDLMHVKRALSEESIDRKSLLNIVDEIAERLRDICQDLAPRDLKDCGLQMVLEDLVNAVSNRSGLYCLFDCAEDLPPLPHEVELHVYRVVQECFNNILKHAGCSRVILRAQVTGGSLCIAIEDDGSGFDVSKPAVRSSSGSGSGLSIMRERTELIRQFYPASISIESQAGKGTVTRLQITLKEQK